MEILKEDLLQAMSSVHDIYNDMNSVAKDIVKEYTAPIDILVKQIKSDINNLTNEDVRRIELKLSLLAYDLGELKDKTNIAAEVAEIVQDEAQANAWNTAEGNNEQRKNASLLAVNKEKVISKLYKLVASQIKTKLDETHRIVDTLKSILISRASDRKLTDNYENTGNTTDYDSQTGEVAE